MTRVFPAEAYGVNGIIMTSSTVVSSIGLLGLPIALARRQAGEEQARLLRASVQLAVLLFLLCAVVAIAISFAHPQLGNGITNFVLLLFPLLVLTHSAQRISDALATARGTFKAQAVARITNSLTARGLALVMGLAIKPIAAMMLIGDAIGRVVHVTIATRQGGASDQFSGLQWRPDIRSLKTVIRDYSRFATDANLASVLPVLTTLGIQTLIAIRLGTGSTGQYVLAQSILTLPVSLIALASAPVIFHHMVRIADQATSELPHLLSRTMLAYLVVGAVCMLPFIVVGPELFAFVFGANWRPAGQVAALLALPQIMAFSLTGVIAIFRVTHQIRAWLGYELAGVAVVLGGLTLLGSDGTLDEAALTLAVLLGFYQVLMHAGCLWASRQTHRLNEKSEK